MDLKEIMTITEMPGIYKVLAKRNDGVIVLGLHDESRKFVPSRKHMFTPLENITMYTTDEPVELKVVLTSMIENREKFPIPDSKDSESNLRAYLKEILPTYDDEKVYISDIRKLVKWFSLLEKHDLLKDAEPAEVEGNALVSEASSTEKESETIVEEIVVPAEDTVEDKVVAKAKKTSIKKAKTAVEETESPSDEPQEAAPKAKKTKKKSE